MLAISSSGQIRSTLFEGSLNPETKYYPYLKYPFLINDSKDNIDLFYTILSSLSTLNQPSVNRTSPDFQRFISYLKPAYDIMMNTTKYRLHNTFEEVFKQSLTMQKIFIVFHFAFLALFGIILLYLCRNFMRKVKNIISIPLDFNKR
jgi:hypothetical protein